MNSPSKNLLLVCWDFPPNNGIGGRRWAKMAKELARHDYRIDVICKKKHEKESISTWMKDVETHSLTINYLEPTLLSQWLVEYSKPYKVKSAMVLLKLKYKGTIYDKAIGLQEEFLKLASEIIRKKKISTVIATGAPFNLIYYAALLREKFADIKIITDYRDPWITAENYGMKGLSDERMKVEKEKQNTVFENASFVTCPNSFLLKEIKNSYSGRRVVKAKFIELLHFFDEDDKVIKGDPKKGDTITFVYGGTLYIDSDKHLQLLNEAISYFKQSAGNVKLKFEFYTNETHKSSIFENNKDCVAFYKPIGDKIFERIANCDYVMILLAEHNKNYITSKFFEFLPYKKKYFFVGPKGYVSNKIEEDNLGFVFSEKEQLEEAVNFIKTESNSNDISKYSLKSAANEFIDRVGI